MLNESKYDIPSAVSRRTGRPVSEAEPVFLFRAKDRHSVQVLGVYMTLCKEVEHRQAINDVLRKFIQWQHGDGVTVCEPSSMPQPALQEKTLEPCLRCGNEPKTGIK